MRTPRCCCPLAQRLPPSPRGAAIMCRGHEGRAWHPTGARRLCRAPGLRCLLAGGGAWPVKGGEQGSPCRAADGHSWWLRATEVSCPTVREAGRPSKATPPPSPQLGGPRASSVSWLHPHAAPSSCGPSSSCPTSHPDTRRTSQGSPGESRRVSPRDPELGDICKDPCVESGHVLRF